MKNVQLTTKELELIKEAVANGIAQARALPTSMLFGKFSIIEHEANRFNHLKTLERLAAKL